MPQRRHPQHKPSPSGAARSHQGAILAGLLVLAVGVVAWNFWPRSTDHKLLILQGREWLAKGQFRDAREAAERVLQQQPDATDALWLAAQAAAGDGEQVAAAALYERVAATDPRRAEALLAAGEAWTMLGQNQQAERCFKQSLEVRPDLLPAMQRLSNLYSVEGRSWERVPYLRELLRRNAFTLFELQGLAHPESFAGPAEDLQGFRAAAPTDPSPLVGLGVVEYREGRFAEAEALMRQAVQLDPQTIQGQALLGWLIHERNDNEDWLRWLAECPRSAFAHPLVWLVQGVWMEDRGEMATAVRCYLEALSRDPFDAVANLRAGQTLAAIGRTEAAAYFQWRAAKLLALGKAVDQFERESGPTAERIDTIVPLLEELGRNHEAHAWRAVQAEAFPQHALARSELARLRQKIVDQGDYLAGPNGLVPPQLNPQEFSLPDWDTQKFATTKTPSPTADGQVTFHDQAVELGMEFQYECGYRPDQGARFMRQSFGGGVAAWDYDGDGWTDLYWTQGCDWPPDPQATQIDRLYRQRGDGKFIDTTVIAGLGDNQFGQGLSAADLDNDGWQDLYVANLGINRLYRNNGDGTFDEISGVADSLPPVWTASCLIADLNGDTWPDLYDATYLGGDNLHTKVCGAHACGPHAFPAEQDRLWLSTGDGRWRECGEAAGILAPLGHGLGNVAADFDGSGRLSLFIANDQTPNFFFLNQTPQPGAAPAFVEKGMLVGLAVDGWGRSQACMGVACGDPNGDGLIDLYVTNFVLESNTLYLNQGQGESFLDATARYGLQEPSIPMVGFGTQFIDGELDGWPDLIVTNGHVDDFRDDDRGYKMRPQYYRNQGGAQFEELPADMLGPYFAGEYLGRGLARLDWNRDGREDAAVSNMEAPAALLTNTTRKVGHYLAVQLRGVASARDAFGATVRVVADGRVRVAQLTAGDGYYASNQRQLLFGLGQCDRVEELTVQWPSGLAQTFRDVAVDAEWLLVESGSEPVRLTKD